MRWMWIDQIVEFEEGRRMVAVKNVSMAEEHLHDHFPADALTGEAAQPIMPASLIIEGMAQTAGILVGSVRHFQEKVILAKIVSAVLEADVTPGQSIRYEATLERVDDAGASSSGIVSRFDHRVGRWQEIGRIELMFSHVDRNLAGIEFPEENFVFSDNFRTILRGAGLEHLQHAPRRT
jgi:3-hydroxyacyl-[acyl-carrier-protein] dehydratase